MQQFYFNSRSELDRYPTGAVAAGTKIRIGVRTVSEINAKEILLIVSTDEDGTFCTVPLAKVWTANGFDRFEGEFAAEKAGLFWYWFSCDGILYKKSVNSTECCMDNGCDWQLTVYADNYNTPDWIKTGAYYHIFVDRFCRAADRPHREDAVLHLDWNDIPYFCPEESGETQNNDFFGGDLDGVIAKLPYLSQLGVTCIYLSPIFEAASNHKYDTGDYMKLDPSFGDDEVFARLCTEAKSFGIRVICDGVFNHTGADSRYFDKFSRYGGAGAYNRKSSPYYKWYSFTDWPEEYECWWGIKSLPEVNKADPEYLDYALGNEGVLQKWLELGCSGWRLDVADELPESFIIKLRERVKLNGEDKLIIGEVWEDASNKISYGERRHYFLGNELDGVMNYPLKDGIISFVTTGKAEALREVVESLCENYPKPSLDCTMNILGTHDTARILSVLGGNRPENRESRAVASLSGIEYETAREKLFAASLLQFTLPGVPCVFYGDEAGLQGWEDPFCRRCYPWGHEDEKIVSWYKSLLAIRKQNAVFSGGSYRTVIAASGAFVFEREGNGQKITVAVNLGDAPCPLPLPPGSTVLLEKNMQRSPDGMEILSAGFAIAEV
ncbi:MAG: DUF3459 domain-containing protein [Clostridia bacterium]|nr:DUF3459 domain-containing protein [Clostridia bacterium]